MFREFAMTLSIAVVVSAVVSLTLTPMMCARLLKAEHGEGGRLSRMFNGMMEAVIRGYGRSLEFVLRHQPATLVVAVLTVVLTVWLYVIMPKGFLPDQDTGALTAVVEASPQVSFTEMSRIQQEVAAVVAKDPDVTGVASIVGIGPLNATQNVGSLKIFLKPLDQRDARIDAVISRLKAATRPMPGVKVYYQPVQDVQISTQSSRSRYQYTLVSTDTAEVSEWSKKLAEALRASSAVRSVALEEVDGGHVAQITVDRVTAGRLGVTMQAVNDTLSNAFGQRQVSTIYAQANQYRVVLEAQSQYRSDPSRLTPLVCALVDDGRAGSAELGRNHRVHHRPARHQPSGSVPGRHHQLQSRAQCLPERRADGDRRRPQLRSACRNRSPARSSATRPNSRSRCRASPGSSSPPSSPSTSCSACSMRASSTRSRS